jgi:predicted N-acetyltransferase YhbS
MTNQTGISIRTATPDDAKAVAELHADSWRRHYRGAYADAYLDGNLMADRLEIWTDRLRASGPDAITLLAEADGHVVGFIHAVLDADPVWGALVDNLHVTYSRKRSGVGTRLLSSVTSAVLQRRPTTGLYLWVLEQNVAAQRFYTTRDGLVVETAAAQPPGGNPEWLNGAPLKLRIAWTDLRVLAVGGE